MNHWENFQTHFFIYSLKSHLSFLMPLVSCAWNNNNWILSFARQAPERVLNNFNKKGHHCSEVTTNREINPQFFVVFEAPWCRLDTYPRSPVLAFKISVASLNMHWYNAYLRIIGSKKCGVQATFKFLWREFC